MSNKYPVQTNNRDKNKPISIIFRKNIKPSMKLARRSNLFLSVIWWYKISDFRVALLNTRSGTRQ